MLKKTVIIILILALSVFMAAGCGDGDIEEADTPEVSADAPEVSADAPESQPEDISPEFRELVDSYEARMYEYIVFLKTYDENDEAQQERFRELSSVTIDLDRKLIELEKAGMTEAEKAYYQAAVDRVGEKYLEADIAMG